MKRLLVGVDGSSASAAALGWAVRFAACVDAEVVVAHAFEPDQAEVSPDAYEELASETEHRLNAEWSKPLQLSRVAHRGLLLPGSIDTLLEAADVEDVDLVVVGTTGGGGFTGLHIGSVAHHLAHHTLRPLAIVPEAGAGEGIGRIVVGVDGSETSAAAMRWCADLAATAHAEVIAVHAFEPLAGTASGEGPYSWRDTVQEQMRGDWVAPLVAAGVALRRRIIEDRLPVDALGSVAEDVHASLLIVGTRGLSKIIGLRLGSVPIHLAHHTHLPVILIPPALHPATSAAPLQKATRDD